jgi:hypothetical protein
MAGIGPGTLVLAELDSLRTKIDYFERRETRGAYCELPVSRPHFYKTKVEGVNHMLPLAVWQTQPAICIRRVSSYSLPASQ